MTDKILAALELIAAVSVIVTMTRAHRRALREHPAVAYSPEPDAPTWRLSEPPEGLELTHASEASVVELPIEATGGQAFAEVSGLALAVAGLALPAYVWFTNPATAGIAALFFLPVCWSIAAVSLTMSRELRAIEFGAGEVVFHEASPLLLHRATRWKGKQLRVKGKVQSVLSQDGHSPADYYFTLRGWLNKRRYRARLNQTQGTWLLGALEAWRRG